MEATIKLREAMLGQRYARTSREAFGPRTLRAITRSAYLRCISSFWAWPQQKYFVRCLFGHAVFESDRAKLAEFLKSLRNVGEFVDTDGLLKLCRQKEKIEGRYFHWSFDDGFKPAVEYAAPVLVDHGIKAIFFITTSYVEKSDVYATATEFGYALNGPIEFATWSDIRQLSQAGMEIGCHTHTHPRLSAVATLDNVLELGSGQELSGSKALIERETNRQCRFFAWPFGEKTDVNDAAIRAIAVAGFEASFGGMRGSVVAGGQDLFRIPRNCTEAHWPLREKMLFALGYDGPSWAR